MNTKKRLGYLAFALHGPVIVIGGMLLGVLDGFVLLAIRGAARTKAQGGHHDRE